MEMQVITKRGRKTIILKPEWKSEIKILNEIGVDRMLKMSIAKCKLQKGSEVIPIITLTDKR